MHIADFEKVKSGADEPRPPAGPEPFEFTLAGSITHAREHPYIVKGLLELGKFAVIFGEPGAGKSHLALELALCVAMGRPFFGRKVQRGAVLYLAGEGVSGLHNRIVAARMAEEITGEIPLAIVGKAVVMHEGNVDPQRVTATAKALEAATGLPVLLIIVDTLARSMLGDENSAEDMGAFVRACYTVIESIGATVTPVHHSGKDAARGARGSSALKGATDTELEVTGISGPRTLSNPKQRDLAAISPVAFNLESVTIGTDRDGDLITAPVVKDAGPAVVMPKARGKQQGKLLAELERYRKRHRTV